MSDGRNTPGWGSTRRSLPRKMIASDLPTAEQPGTRNDFDYSSHPTGQIGPRQRHRSGCALVLNAATPWHAYTWVTSVTTSRIQRLTATIRKPDGNCTHTKLICKVHSAESH